MSNASDFVTEKGYFGNPDEIVFKKIQGNRPTCGNSRRCNKAGLALL